MSGSVSRYAAMEYEVVAMGVVLYHYIGMFIHRSIHHQSAPLARRDRAPLQAIQLAELLCMSLSVLASVTRRVDVDG
jgi:hypothetical protein